jgi:hypothetical protein
LPSRFPQYHPWTVVCRRASIPNTRPRTRLSIWKSTISLPQSPPQELCEIANRPLSTAITVSARGRKSRTAARSHSNIRRVIRHQQLRQVVPFTFQTVLKVSKTIANLSTESLAAVRTLIDALVKEYARPYETLREDNSGPGQQLPGSH